MVWFWYPATPDSGAKPGAYLPGKWGRAIERDRGPFLWQRLDWVQVHAIPDAPVSAAQPGYPVLIFSTGYGRVPTDYTVLAEDLGGALFGDVPRVGLKQPCMFVLGERATPPRIVFLTHRFSRREAEEELAREIRDMDSASRAALAAYKVSVHGARHFNFSDSAVLFSPIMKAGGTLGSIEGARGRRITSDYVRAFLYE